VAEEGSLATLAADAAERPGTVDVLIDAAGHFPQNAVDDITGNEWRRVIEVTSPAPSTPSRPYHLSSKQQARSHHHDWLGRDVLRRPASGSLHRCQGRRDGLDSGPSARAWQRSSITVNLVTRGPVVTPAAAAVLPEPRVAMQRNLRSIHRDGCHRLGLLSGFRRCRLQHGSKPSTSTRTDDVMTRVAGARRVVVGH
jgi:hypothetical protein